MNVHPRVSQTERVWSADGKFSPRIRTGSVSGRAGLMLVECLVYMAVFAWLMVVGFATYNAWEKSSFRLQRSASDIARVMTAGEQWREDVRRATAPLKVVTTEEAVAIHVPQGGNEIIYVSSGSDLRRTSRGSSRSSLLLANVKSSTMRPGERQFVTEWVWELELKTDRKAMLPARFQFQAVVPQKP